ncbi:hypothetical protein SUDANB171_00146 [Streptomyces sp. enrichment culture]|uniref:NACHT domain-containing protein n=1 Tax=Streptomyces sp. enrichment culture TaxID=1795815 RepID=UPI003F55C531
MLSAGRADAIDLIDQVLPTMHRDAAGLSAEDVYRHLLDRSGLLREPAEGVVDFIHRTFQDYLAARAAVENRDFPLLVRNAHLDQWEDVIRMAVAHGRPEERKRLLKQLIKRGDTVKKHRVRLPLLAMACLEHATQLDPEVRREVEERAAALIPPRTWKEAESLAAIGKVVLELLPGPERLTDDEAESVVVTAAVVGGDAAFAKLAEYGSHSSHRVRSALLYRWEDFDPDRFGTQILAGLPLDDEMRLSVRSSRGLAALRSMPDYPFLSLFEGFSADEIVPVLRKRTLRQLSLCCEKLADLDFLRDMSSLESLSLIEGPIIRDLSPLKHLPLRDLLLRQLPELHDFSLLNTLSQLRYLYVGDGMTVRGLDSLPTDVPLTDLALRSSIADLTGVGRWPKPETLRILDSDHLPGSGSLTAIAELPALTNLVIPPRLLRAFAERGISLPHVDHLGLVDSKERLELREVAAVLPGLRSLVLSGAPAELDPGPLEELDKLRLVTVRGHVRLAHPERLPHVTVDQPLESRY